MESKSGHQSSLYYLVAWKGYSEKENIWDPFSAVQDFRKLIKLFYKNHPEKPIAISPPINSAPPMTRPIVKPTAKSTTKRKRGRPANNASKQAKKNWTFCLFSQMALPWSIRLLVRSIFTKQRWFSFSNHPIRLGGFLPTISLLNNFSHLSIFPP